MLLEDGTRRYIWGLGLAYEVEGTAVLVYHVDGLGSVRALTDSTRAVVQTYESDEFGVPISAQGGSAQPFGYTGEQRDAEAGLVYLRARYYDPLLGRFISRDRYAGLIRGPASLNRYSYVGNNPILYSDPKGKKPAKSPRALSCDGSSEALDNDAAAIEDDLEGIPHVPAPGEGTDCQEIGGHGHDHGPTPTDLIKHLIKQDELDAARIEFAGRSVVNRPSDGKSWNHIKEVWQVQNKLRNRIYDIKNRLGYPYLDHSERLELMEELGEARRLLDYTEQFVPDWWEPSEP